MEIIQEIGSYAGLAAIVGLAVLSALYFSQARDVKRLREWAGRAPERAAQPAQPAVPQRVVAQPQPLPKPAAATPGALQPAPAAQGADQSATPKPAIPPHIPGTAPAIAASAGARPATATAAAAAGAGTAAATAERPGGSGAATPAGQGKQAPADGEAPSPGADMPSPAADTPQPEAATSTAEEKPAEGAQQDSTESQAPAAVATAQPPEPAATPASQGPVPSPSGAATPAGQARPTPPAPPRISRPALPPRPGPQPTAIIPPGSSGASGAAARRLPRSRVVALVVAGVLVLGGGAAFAVSQLTGDDGNQASAPAGSPGSADGDGGATKGADGKAMNPSDVTVAVLNGTLVPGLAAAIGDEVEKLGFDLGTLGNADNQEQQRAESVVLYASGHKPEAVVVSRRLKIPQREAIDPDTQALAGDASVVVVAGGDQTP